MKSAIRVEAAAALILDGAMLLMGVLMEVGSLHQLADATLARRSEI
jgi:hypothetical protein